jgi:asparagine synthase (glutamine-hydrolysing)
VCGIAGILDFAGQPVDRGILTDVCSALAHRGPDAHGYWLDGQIGLGHQRLSIIDLSTGAQPLANEDRSIWITFNGEIYNFADLTQRMRARGHEFRTRSDTEAIVHAYEEYGVDCVRELRGMFAFAIWDSRTQKLVLARDRVGKKPLFYAKLNDQFVFASELHALARHPALSRDVDPAAIDAYLTYGYIPGPQTIYRGVFKLPPAHYITISRQDDRWIIADPVRYWHLDYEPKLDLDDTEAAAALLEQLREAVRVRLVSDVPVGALLSGGTDSSLVVALMAEQSREKIRTFSIGFDEGTHNELPYARAVAERFQTEHHEFVVRPSALELLPTLVRHYGEPFADSSAIPTYYLARLTRDHVKVALNGDGADESLAGYERYMASLAAERYRRIPAAIRAFGEPMTSLIPEHLAPRNRLRQFKRFTSAASLPVERRYLRWMSYFSADQKKKLYSAAFAATLDGDPGAWLAGILDGSEGKLEHLDRLLAADVASYLPYDLLVKMDIATMANSLEARSPFLDHEVMEFCARLPTRLKVRRGRLKYLEKKVALEFLPAANIKRRKMGFGVPIATWLRSELRPFLHDVLLSPAALGRGMFDAGMVRQLVSEHERGVDRSFQLWSLLWLEMWHLEFAC